MSNLSIHLITETEDINYIIKKYNISYEELLINNRNLKKYSNLGKIIYINKDRNMIILNQKTEIMDIIFLQRFLTISYINKYDDYSLIKNTLLSKIDNLNFKNSNIDVFVIKSILKKLNDNVIEFIDELTNKSYININNIKEEITNNISSISSLLNIYNIKIIMEKILLSSIKIINKNYYESYNIISSIINDF